MRKEARNVLFSEEFDRVYLDQSDVDYLGRIVCGIIRMILRLFLLPIRQDDVAFGTQVLFWVSSIRLSPKFSAYVSVALFWAGGTARTNAVGKIILLALGVRRRGRCTRHDGQLPASVFIRVPSCPSA